MAIECWIESITFRDGTTVSVPRNGVLVLVGPNNAGKTQSLSDIPNILSDYPNRAPSVVVADVALHRTRDSADVLPWLEEHAWKANEGGRIVYYHHGQQSTLYDLQAAWASLPANRLGVFTGTMLRYLDVESRAGLVGAGAVNTFGGRPEHPVHFLYRDSTLEERISAICSAVFGHRLTLQRLGNGSSPALRIGTVDVPVPPLNRPTIEYAKAEEALPSLMSQGHGMRSYVGLVLSLLVQQPPVYLIDEPEAFLHPPQRRSLGRLVSDLVSENACQAVIATHDTEFLWGVLDGGAEVSVVRLTRDGDVTSANRIDAADARELWNDPILRYSRLFDGLFYERVAVCESDADCRFYASVFESLVEQGDLARSDVLFVPVGGKERVHVALAALRRAGVDVMALLDFDALRDKASLRRILESVGGSWVEIERDWNVFSSAVAQRTVTNKAVSDLRDELTQLMAVAKGARLDKDLSRRLTQAVAFMDGWDAAKHQGLGAVPSSDPTVACRQALQALRISGIHIVPYGELESAVREVGGHGPAWVAEVLARGLHTSAREPRDYIRSAFS